MAISDSLASWLPQGPGLLPGWILLVSFTAVFNSLQAYTTTTLTRRLYNTVPSVTPLQTRTFAAWTLMSAVVRGYTAYNIHNKILYDMTLLSFLIAFGHFGSEVLIFRTARLNGPVLSPVIVSTASLLWMLREYETYVKA